MQYQYQFQICCLMIDATNIFCGPIHLLESNPQIQQEIQEISNNAKAIQMHLINSIKKVWKHLTPQWQQNNCFKKFYFDKMREYIDTCKSKKLVCLLMRSFYPKLQQRIIDKRQRKDGNRLMMDKIGRIKVKIIFGEWKKAVSLQLLTKKVQKQRKKQLFKELIVFFKENTRNMLSKKMKIETINFNSHHIYVKSLLKISFQAFILNNKMNKVTQTIRNTRFVEFKVSLTRYNRQSKTKGTSFHQNRLKYSFFFTWKQQYLNNIATHTYKAYLSLKYFTLWKCNLPILASQKQIDLNNQCIINIAQQRSNKKITLRVFLAWRAHLNQIKQLRYHSDVLNRYADVKSKELLLRKYFQKLRLNRLNNQVRVRYRDIKLKRKVMDALKIVFSQSVQKQEGILTFIQQREIRKYFAAIQEFNRTEKQKIERHRLQKLFKQFSYVLIKEYYHKNQLSNTYRMHNLLFKSVFALRKEAVFSRKERYIIAWTNIINPLKRWRRQFTIQKYLHHKKYALLQQIFREWKLRIVRRDTQRKLVKQFKQLESNKKSANDSKTEVFQFQNIMATIAKIRNNFNAERSATMPNNSSRWDQIHTPSQSINFSYSLQNQ